MGKLFSLIGALVILLLFSAAGISYAWEFNIIGTIRETFDDNIRAIAETPLQKKKYDYISEILIALGLHHEGKTYTLDLMGHVNQQIYARHFGLTNNNQDAALNLTKAFSELVSFQISEVFQNFPEPDTFENLFGTSEGRMRYWRNNFNLTGIFEANKYYLIRLIYTNSFSKYFYTRNSRWYTERFFYPINLNQDLKYSLVNTARMQHEIHWDSSNYTYLFYEYQWTRSYPGGILQVHRPGVGYRHDFTRQLFIEGRVSPDFVFSPHNTRGNITALGVQYVIPPSTPYDISLYTYIMVSHDVDQRTNASLNFTYQNSVLANNADPTTNWRIDGNITRQIFDKLLFTSSAFYGEVYIFTTKTTNRLVGLSVSATYEFTEHVSATMSYNFTWNYAYVAGYSLIGGYVYSNGAAIQGITGYYRNRVSLALNGTW
ncbi:MAG: hypothetical protein KA369_11505 [Spirochaetes bacterium]|nr:hypothetical protein [Spirochaetota bacterium]